MQNACLRNWQKEGSFACRFRKRSGLTVLACSRIGLESLGRSTVKNSNRAMVGNARAFSLCVAIALTVSCESSRNRADDAKAVADAIRQQIEKYTAPLDA